jgi:diaminopropionate ammonia-lyase
MKRCKGTPPRFILIELSEAVCLYQSSINQRPTPPRGNLRTLTAGLACGKCRRQHSSS